MTKAMTAALADLADQCYDTSFYCRNYRGQDPDRDIDKLLNDLMELECAIAGFLYNVMEGGFAEEDE